VTSFQIPSLPLTEPGWVFGLLFALILVVPVLSQRLRLPVVVGFVLAGMLVGPGVGGLLERAGGVELLGTAGLLYLMFIAGLELDLDEFVSHRRASFTFGVTSFAVPMLLGSAAMLALGFEVLAAVLLASCWASHTLVAYPEFQRFGTARNRGVSVTVGATILTDTAALLVLAVVAGLHRGAIGPAFWLTLVPAIVALLVAAFWVLPAIGRRFFSGLGQDTSVRFLFVIAVVFVFAGSAELAGIEGIVGAFLAGLAMNRLVPHSSALMERLEFFGDQFMIPLFLISVGLLIDPRVLVDPRALLLGAAFTAVALLAKFVAAEGTGRWFGYDRPEIGAMFSLSSAQAAATLAAIMVGVEIGLIDTVTLNAVIAVIAVTCLLSSWLANRYARQLPHPPPRTEIGATVVVPVVRPGSARPLVRLAAALALPDSGRVLPVVVVPPDIGEERLDAAVAVREEATTMARSFGVEAEGAIRVDASPPAGIHHLVVERRATLMVVGWKGTTHRREALFGGILDEIVARAEVPTIIGRLDERPIERIVIPVPATSAQPGGWGSYVLAVETARRLRAQQPRPALVVAELDSDEVAAVASDVLGGTYEHDPQHVTAALRERVDPDDLIVLPVEPGRARLPVLGVRVAQAFPENPLLVVVDGAHRPVGDLNDEQVPTEHPFGPPPWARTG
jgi:Kef-type K+ transport system membrane component KefB/nucleotide-binding universal stress UspA family protein